jgi:pyruvate/2-oxoglutarate dehydrogenase complex dihydrolipoamide acyltransferase (E2) component
MSSRDIILPELGLGKRPITLSMWLVKTGARVVEGDPVVEVMADGVTVDLPAPADGFLRKRLVRDGELLTVRQRLAVMEDDSE